MTQQENRRTLYLIGLLALLAMVFAACAAPAAAPTTGAADAPAAEAPASDLPAEPGRGTDGPLKLVYWQEVSILNPYLSTGTKDYHAASLILESLIEVMPDGTLIPALAQEVPTLENGGISEDLTTITYQLKPDVVWSDGTPLTADDVIFTWQFCVDPDTGCSSAIAFTGVQNVEAVDPQTVKITFDGPTPYPYNPFGGYLAPVLQKAQFEGCIGAAAQGCSEQNTAPIGTGPYKVKEFRANDTVVYDINENYRDPNKPHFSEVTFSGAEDASASARAVLETGEADYGWNLQVEPAVLNEMAAKGNGTVGSAFAGNVERILINFTNPDANLGDLRSVWSADAPNPHPFLSDPAVRQALSMAIDRTIIAEQLYGAGGVPTCNVLSGPPAVVSTNNDACKPQDIEGATALLEGAGWVDSNGDGTRDKDGVELKILYQTSTNSVRQKTQALVQQWWQQIGVATELKNVEAAVYFGGDPASPDTLGKFYADVQMFTNGPEGLDPQTYLAGWLCEIDGKSNIASPENDFNANNTERWCSPEYDAKFAELKAATDPADRAAIAIELNDMLAQNYVNLPLIFRASVSAYANDLANIDVNGWDSEEWNIEEWHRVR
jgi:peptide/nickel transport system substrate-binding protein